MADGEVLINTKINTDGAKEDLKRLKEELKESAEISAESAVKIEKSFDKVDLENIADGMADSFKKESQEAVRSIEELTAELPESYRTIYDKINKIREEDTLNHQAQVDKISEQFTLLGQDQEEAARKAWKIVTAESEDGSRKVIDNLQDIINKSKDTGEEIEDNLGGEIGDKLMGIAKKAGSAMAAAFAVDKTVEFGKQSIELGSDLQEVQNVVDVTFTSMSEKVNDFARDAAASAGLSETMAKKYVGTFGAMADSFGFTEQEAYEMSTALTQLTGDVASFYNLDHDEAYTKLKSVFTGETESLKDLGVVMTQTALDDYAMRKGLQKTTAQMTEQEKVALRYEFVLEQLSGAAGDFTRTQESWANQTRILSLQWESLQATVGQGLINAFTPALEFINNSIIPGLQALADEFAEAFEPTPADNLNASIESLNKSVETAESKFSDTSAEIELNAITAEQCAKKLEELQRAGLDTAESQQEYASAVDYLNQLVPGLNANIDEQTGLIDKNTDEIYASIDAMKRQALYQAEQARYSEVLEARAEAQLEVNDAEKELLILQIEQLGLQQRLSELTEETTGKTNGFTQSVLDFNDAMMASELTTGDAMRSFFDLGETIAGVKTEEELLREQIQQHSADMIALNEKIEEGKGKISECDELMELWSTTITQLSANLEGLEAGQGEVTTATELTTQSVQVLKQEYDAARETAKQSINSQIGLFDELQEKSDKSARQIVDNWKKQQTALQNYSQNMQKAIDMGLDEALVQQLSDGSEQSMLILDELVNSTDVGVGEINAAYRGVEESKDVVASTMADIQTGMSEKLDQMAADVEREWGDMADEVGDAIYDMQEEINSLKGKTVNIDIEYRVKGAGALSGYTGLPGLGDYSVLQPSTYSIEPESYYSLPNSIPYLAEGAVIPPRAPFVAVLGDQRSGYNIEAPADMIRDIVREEVENSAVNDEVVSLLQTLVGVVSSLNIDGHALFDIVSNEERKRRIISGG